MFVEQGTTIKADVYRALLFEHEMPGVQPDFTADFIELGLRLITMVSHAQMVELVSDQLERGQLTAESLAHTLEDLTKRVDLTAEKFGKQVDLLHELDEAPEELN